MISTVFALNSDFNNDGKVDFDDFFLFADNFQKDVNKDNEKFDLDKNKKINVYDFFIFADEFEKVSLAGDFDNNGCVDEKDFYIVNEELRSLYESFFQEDIRNQIESGRERSYPLYEGGYVNVNLDYGTITYGGFDEVVGG